MELNPSVDTEMRLARSRGVNPTGRGSFWLFRR